MIKNYKKKKTHSTQERLLGGGSKAIDVSSDDNDPVFPKRHRLELIDKTDCDGRSRAECQMQNLHGPY